MYGVIDNPWPGTEFSIRNAQDNAVCYGNCPGELSAGLIHLNTKYNQSNNRFLMRFDTSAFEPGAYLIDMQVINTNKTVRGWFNVT